MDNKTRTPFDPAVVDAWLEEFKDVPPEAELHHSFSPEFEAKMDALIHREDSAPRRRTGVVLRRVALVAAIIAALLLTSCAIPAVRQMFRGLFVGISVEDHGEEYRFTYDPEELVNAPEVLETVYVPSYIPEGYMIDSYVCSFAGVHVAWRTPDDQWITYDQSPYPEDPTDNSGHGLDAEYSTLEWISLGGGEVLRHESDESVAYYWATSEYRFYLRVPQTLGEEVLQKIFYSIQINEDAEIDGLEPENIQ
ncbi:MAG: DUF4367 domain-containing protein [Oscillospiraceae bacterium]|nr:DUF4367 domain-containing protein [Oscillospiraceae bacterium]